MVDDHEYVVVLATIVSYRSASRAAVYGGANVTAYYGFQTYKYC